MRRHASRHATDTAQVDAIGISAQSGGGLAVRGVASNPAPLVPSQVNPYLPALSPQTIATRPPYDATWNPYPGVPLHVADQLTPGLAERTGPGAFQRLQDWHVWPAAVAVGALICGAGAHRQPLHAWFGTGFTLGGIASLAVYGAVHVARALNGDDQVPAMGVHGIGLGGIGLTAFGIAALSGGSWLTAGVGIGLLTAGYYAYFQTRHSRIQDQRQFVVGYTAASTPALVPMPGAAAAPLPGAIPGEALSHEESIVRRAFADMGIEPVVLRGFERIDKDAFNVIVGLPGSRADDPESVVRRSETLKSNLRANQIAVEASTEQGNEVVLMVRFGSASPILETIPWAGPETDDVTKPIRMGLTHYGEPVRANFAKRHTLFAGKTRRGKSSGMQVAVCSIGATRNGQLWFLDLKPGQLALGPFKAMAAQFADTLDIAALLIAAAVAAMEENGEILKEIGEQTGVPVWEWDPAVHGAGIFIVIDELADLLRLSPEIYEMWLRIMQLGAGLGVYFVCGTQSPSAKALGNSTDGGSQFGNIFGYQSKGATQAGVIFGQGAWGEGWKPSERNLPLQGMFMLRSPEHSHAVVSRGDFIEPNSAMRVADEIAAGPLAQLHPRTQAAVDRVLKAGFPTGTGPARGARGRTTHPEDARPYGRPRLVTLYPDGTKVAPHHQALWELLGQLGREGATVTELAVAAQRAGHDACGLSWVRDRCKEWRVAGYVELEEEGRDTRYWRDDESVKQRLGRGA